MEIKYDYSTKLTSNRFYHDQLDKIAVSISNAAEKDREKIVQSAAVRRLQQKTQVYPLELNASVRSRLTHSLEVQQIGRSISRKILQKLQINNQLEKLNLQQNADAFISIVEQACLLHDVGNPPFGHFGEKVICNWFVTNLEKYHDQAIKNNKGKSKLFAEKLLPDLLMFDGNAQGVRIIHSLQKLNLTFSQIASIIKYTAPAYSLLDNTTDYQYRNKKSGFFYSEEQLINSISTELQIAPNCRFPLVYIMEAADDIAYCISDLEDALDKNILSVDKLQSCMLEIWQQLAPHSDYLPNIIEQSKQSLNSKNIKFIDNLRRLLTNDLIEYSAIYYIKNHDVIFNGVLDSSIINSESDQYYALETLKKIAQQYVFTCLEKETPEIRGYAALTGLLDIYSPLLKLSKNDFTTLKLAVNKNQFIEQHLYRQLPEKYILAYKLAIAETEKAKYSLAEINDLEWYYRVRLIIDYISGMTDDFVLAEYQKFSGF